MLEIGSVCARHFLKIGASDDANESTKNLFSLRFLKSEVHRVYKKTHTMNKIHLSKIWKGCSNEFFIATVFN